MSRSAQMMLWIIAAFVLLSAGGILWYHGKERSRQDAALQEDLLPAVKVTLTNGCGLEGAARDFTEFLCHKNVDIVSTGNAASPKYDKTIIVVKKGDDVNLRRLQRMIGLNSKRYTEARNEAALADFEIIIGMDYEQYTKK